MRRVGEAALRLALGFAGACTAAGQDVETPTTVETEPPDLTGTYSAEWSEDERCDAIEGAPTEVPSGDLEIVAAGPDLAFGFEDATFDGTIDETFTFAIDGSETVDGWTVTLAGEGLAYISATVWVLEGDLVMDAVSSGTSAETCQAAGPWVATQVAE